MKLAIDVMGFENSCNEAIVACRHFAKRHKDVTFVLVGKKNEIMHFVRARDRFEIIDAQDVIQMTDQPLTAMRRYETSMYKAVRLVADDQADGVLSAGSTAVYVPMVYYWLKLLPGINKPAFMPLLPTNVKGKMMSILDVGANKECTGQDLYNFALMAKAYFQLIKHYQQPRVGVINIGTEATKGFKYQQDANELLLADKSFNYIGFIEPRSLLNDTVDIAICDGYSGNLTLKAIEGGLKTITGVLKQSYKKIWNWPAAVTSLFLLKHLSCTFDYKSNAGAWVAGLRKVAVKTHGHADRKQFSSAIRLLHEIISHDVNTIIKNELLKRHA